MLLRETANKYLFTSYHVYNPYLFILISKDKRDEGDNHRRDNERDNSEDKDESDKENSDGDNHSDNSDHDQGIGGFIKPT